jgi:hypothetical protein
MYNYRDLLMWWLNFMIKEILISWVKIFVERLYILSENGQEKYCFCQNFVCSKFSCIVYVFISLFF